MYLLQLQNTVHNYAAVFVLWNDCEKTNKEIFEKEKLQCADSFVRQHCYEKTARHDKRLCGMQSRWRSKTGILTAHEIIKIVAICVILGKQIH